MKNNQSFTQKIFNLVLLTGLLVPAFTHAANVLLANKPLVESSTSDVLPNLMFIIDDSGSMNQDYTPDWSNSGDPKLFKNSAYNTQYYNPNIRYLPAVKYDGSSMGNQDPTAAKNAVNEDNTIAIRLVKHKFCQQLIREFGKPIISTSANISGEKTPVQFGQIASEIKEKVDFIVDRKHDTTNYHEPSKLIKINKDNSVTYLR